jgi:hypothetical protein
MHAKRITIHESERRVKSQESVRDLPVPEPLERGLARHFARSAVGAGDLVFAAAFQDYAAVRRVWDATCQAAGITGATPHDARHTFGVHAAQAGVPIVRLQKLMGHATAAMTHAARRGRRGAGCGRADGLPYGVGAPPKMPLANRWRSGNREIGLRNTRRGASFRRSDPVAQLVEQRTFKPLPVRR